MSQLPQTRVTKDQMVAYATDIVFNGLTKKDSYLRNVKDVNQVHIAIARMEKTEEYQSLLASIMGDDAAKLAAKVKRVQDKYVGLMEKNIDTASSVLDGVKDGELKDKAIAVRLVNETVGAMAVVTGATQPQAPGQLNKAGAVIGG